MKALQPSVATETVHVILEPFGDVTMYRQSDAYMGYRWRFKGQQSDWHKDNSVALDELLNKIKLEYNLKTQDNERKQKNKNNQSL